MYTKIPWTLEEIEFLKHNYNPKNKVKLLDKLDHNWKAIKDQAYRLKLTNKPVWYAEDDEFLIKHYKNKGRKYCSQYLNKSRPSVTHRCSKLGLTNQNRNRRWTLMEQQLLANNCLKLTAKECAIMLDRSVQSIRHKISEWNLFKKNKTTYIIEYISLTFWNQLKHNADERNLRFNLLPQDLLILLNKQEFKCKFCNDIISCDHPITASLDRIDNSIDYLISNIQFLCKACNMTKGHYFKTNEDFMKHIIKIANHQKEVK